jgi:hypothetical protein
MAAGAIALSLISHTNAGKTTLARTLLAQSVGEVRDAPHVTTDATPYPLIDTPEGDTLILWDTPGFGDSARLARRLRQQGNPIGWFLSQVWDRFRDRTFWLNQLAVGNVRDRADVVLYLVNASEAPNDAGYLAPELAVLEWIGKPVIVLLNQTGPPRPRDEEAAAEARWREALGQWPCARAVLTLDAFARCWVQEFTLFETVDAVLAPEKRPAFARLDAAWHGRRMAQFDAAMEAIAAPIARAACDRVVLPAASMRDKVVRAIGLARDVDGSAEAVAMRTLAGRFEADLHRSTQQLITIHGLEGSAVGEVLARLACDVRTDAPVDEGKAALMGGVVSGALTGVAADIASGGLTFGAGMLTGALLGALGGAGIARGFNTLRGRTETVVRWDNVFLDGQIASALLRYLAVAHHGRGRGEWRESEYPSFWRELVNDAMTAQRGTLAEIWDARAADGATDRIALRVRALACGIARTLFDELYPGALDGGETADRVTARSRSPR